MIPVFLQILPLLSGVMYEVNSAAREVAVDPLREPHGRRDQRLALGGPRRKRAELAQMLVGVGPVPSLFVIGLTVFRISEPRFADTI